MTPQEMAVERRAVQWLLAVNDPAFVDWQGWEAWLAADPLHDATYWRLAERDAALSEGLRDRSAARRTQSSPARLGPRPRRRFLLAGVAAAAMIFCIGIGVATYVRQAPRVVPWTIETAAGQQRSLRLADGTRLTLNGATRLHLDEAAPRRIVLEQGQAIFAVAHDPSRPFSVTVGDATIRDIGTVFDVTRSDSGLRLSVAEGAVAYRGRGQDVRLRAGQSLTVAGRKATVRTIDASHVGGWRSGRLFYEDAPLADVAADLGRSLGVDIAVSAGARSIRFSGSFRLEPDGALMRARLQPLLGVRIQQQRDGWVLLPGEDPA